MKFLLAFALCLISLCARAATPAFSGFYGSGGITVTTNPTLGTVVISALGGVATNAQPPSSILTNLSTIGLSTTNVVWVSKAGNDTTGLRCRLDLPFQTTAAAKAATIFGDTVMVLPGTYFNCTNLFKNGVNWFGFGATLTHTNQTNTFDPGWGIFDDRFVGAVTSRVEGFSFLWNAGFPSTNASGNACCQNTNLYGALVVTNPLSRCTFDNKRIDYIVLQPLLQSVAAVSSRGGTNCFVWNEGVFDLYRTNSYVAGIDSDGEDVVKFSEATGLYWQRGDVHFNSPTLEGGHYSFWGDDPMPSNTTAIANAFVDVHRYTGTFYVSGNGNSNYKTWARGIELISTQRTVPDAISLISPGFVYLGGFQKILTSGIGITGGSSSEAWIQCQKLSSSGNFASANGGTLHISAQHYDDYLGTVTSGFDVRNGGNLVVEDGTMVLTAGRGGIMESGPGTMILKGVTINTGASTNSPIYANASGLTLSGCTLICTNTKFSITTSVGTTSNVKIYNSQATSTATNLAVVQVGPFTVDPLVQ